MCAAVRVDHDLVAAEDVLAAHGGALCHQRIGDHDRIVGTLAHKVVVQSSRGGMATIADDLTVHGADAVCCTHQTVCAVVEGCHTIIDMGHGACAIGISHDCLLVGGSTVTDADNDTLRSQVAGQFKVIVLFGSQRNIADVTVCSFLIVLELLYAGLCNELLRLCALVLHVQIRTLEVDAKDLGTVVAALHDTGNVGNGIGQNLNALGDGGSQKAGHTLRNDMLRPVTQTFFVCVVGVKLIGTVAVDVHKAGDDTLVTVIVIYILCPIGENADDLTLFDLDSSRYKLICDPYFFTLDYHLNCPPSE